MSPSPRGHTDVSDASHLLLVNSSLGNTSPHHDNAGVSRARLLQCFLVVAHVSLGAAVALWLFLHGVTAGLIGGACVMIFVSMVLFLVATGRIRRAVPQHYHSPDDESDGDRLFIDDHAGAEAEAEIEAEADSQGGYLNRPRCAESSDSSDDTDSGRRAERREGGTERRGERNRLVRTRKMGYDAEKGRSRSYGAVGT